MDHIRPIVNCPDVSGVGGKHVQREEIKDATLLDRLSRKPPEDTAACKSCNSQCRGKEEATAPLHVFQIVLRRKFVIGVWTGYRRGSCGGV